MAEENSLSETLAKENLEFKSKIGCGSFGVVCLAQGEIDKVLYAIKCISIGKFMEKTRPVCTSSIEVAYKMHREVDMLTKLKGCPFIIQYYHCWIDGPLKTQYWNFMKKIALKENLVDNVFITNSSGKLEVTEDEINTKFYIKLEYCHANLQKFLIDCRDRNHKNVAEIKEIMTQILKGLAFMHEKGIIHRDLKPNNVFLNYNDGKISAKIGDLGLARNRLRNSENNATVGAVGCHFYQSPEELVNVDYGFETDIYSLGLIYLELVHTFPDDFYKNLAFEQIQKGNYKILQDIPLTFQKERDMIARMVNADFAKRPTASELLMEMTRMNSYSSGYNSSHESPESVYSNNLQWLMEGERRLETTIGNNRSDSLEYLLPPQANANTGNQINDSRQRKHYGQWIGYFLFILLVIVLCGLVFIYFFYQHKTPVPIYKFAYEAFGDVNFQFDKGYEIFRNKGSFEPHFPGPIMSWNWTSIFPRGKGCCIIMCNKEDAEVGRFCLSAQNPRSNSEFRRIVIGCLDEQLRCSDPHSNYNN